MVASVWDPLCWGVVAQLRPLPGDHVPGDCLLSGWLGTPCLQTLYCFSRLNFQRMFCAEAGRPVLWGQRLGQLS